MVLVADELAVIVEPVVVIIELEVVELLLEVVVFELDIVELLLDELKDGAEETILVEVVVVDRVVAVVLEDELVEVLLEEVIVKTVDDETAARLLYICKAFEPPHISAEFPLQVIVQAGDPTALPPWGEFPQ